MSARLSFRAAQLDEFLPVCGEVGGGGRKKSRPMHRPKNKGGNYLRKTTPPSYV